MILDKVDSVSRKYEKVFIFHIREKKTRNSYVICPLNFSYFIFTKWQNASFFSYFIFTKSQNAFFFIFLIYFLKFFFRYFIFLIFAFLHISYLHFYCLQNLLITYLQVLVNWWVWLDDFKSRHYTILTHTHIYMCVCDVVVVVIAVIVVGYLIS